MPRVLVVQRELDVEGVEWAVAPDGEAAVVQAACERFDTVVVHLDLPALDGWMLLATVGSWEPRPRLIATIGDRADIPRARALGADLCVLAGTHLHARALDPAWQRHPVISSRRPTTSGVSA